MKLVIVSPAAESDVATAFDWYESKSPGLGDRFLSSVRSVLERIAEAPLAFPQGRRGTRRAQLFGFPFAIFFKDTDEAILIIAILHGRRGPTVRAVRNT